MQGTWDSIHVVEVTDNGSTADYSVTLIDLAPFFNFNVVVDFDYHVECGD